MRVKISGVHGTPPSPAFMARQYPPKTGKCAITDCKRKNTDWHHIISQAQIIKRGLPESMFTDPGNLQELCRHHHDMTTASISRKQLTKKHGPMGKRKRKRRMTDAERKAAKEKRQQERVAAAEKQMEERQASIPILEARGAYDVTERRGRPSVRVSRKHIRRHSRKDEKAKKWWKFLERSGNRPFIKLYPPDHWLHDPEAYDEALSKEFESDGYIWSGRGGAVRAEEGGPSWQQVVCAKCNRIGHGSERCYAKTVEVDPSYGGINEKAKEGLPRRFREEGAEV